MTTEPATRRPHQIASRRRRAGTVQRYNRRTRWFHAGIYLTVLVLLATGWWLRLGQEGRPSPLARIAGVPDTELQRTGRIALLSPGEEVPLTVAWHDKDGSPARVDYGDGWLSLPG